jgi:hypothetical protein
MLRIWTKYFLASSDKARIEVHYPDISPAYYVYLDLTGTQSTYSELLIGLPDYDPSQKAHVWLRFRLIDTNDGQTADGWYVDDVRIYPGLWGRLSERIGAPSGGAEDENYIFCGGTSMATPLTAGAATLVRQYYTDIAGVTPVAGQTPSAALIKATLINGAIDMPGQYTSGGVPPNGAAELIPNYHEGWGRVALTNSIFPDPPRSLEFKDAYPGLANGGDIDTYAYGVSSSEALKVTLAWTDCYETAAASGNLVNDLNLRVTAPDGTRYYGNDFVDGFSREDALPYNPNYDSHNNVENVYIQAPVQGTYVVEVIADSIDSGPQPYALVVSYVPLASKSITGPGNWDRLDPSVAADDWGNVYVAYVDNGNGPNIYFTKSTDGGATFSPAIQVNDAASTGMANSPSIAVDRAGLSIGIIWTDGRNGPGESDIYYSVSTTGGATWSSNVRVNDDVGHASQSSPALAAGDRGLMFAAWVDNRNGVDSDIYSAFSADGLSFGPNTMVNKDDNVSQEAPDVDLLPPYPCGGSCPVRRYVVWSEGPGGEIYFSQALRDAPFSEPAKLSGSECGSFTNFCAAPTISVVDYGGHVYAAWTASNAMVVAPSDIYFTRSLDWGLSFDEGKNVTLTGPYIFDTQPSLALGTDFNLGHEVIYLIYSSAHWEFGAGPPFPMPRLKDFNILLSSSSDFGVTFSPGNRVNDDTGSADQKCPSIAVSQEVGSRHIVWEDYRNGYADIYYTIQKQ